MSSEAGPVLRADRADPRAGRGSAAERLSRFGSAVFRQTVTEPVAAGRLRDVQWPYGLKAIVAAGYAVFALAAAVVIGSGIIRQQSTLIIAGTLGLGVPGSTIWPMIVVLAFGTAAFMSAALHGPWWVKLVGLVFVLAVTGTWALRRPSISGWSGYLVLAAAVMVAIVVFVVLRWRRTFAWWEFVVFFALVGAAMTVAVLENRLSRSFGADQTPLLLNETAAVLGYLALPAATIAGASVAEVTVRATLSATRNAQRFTRRGWPYVVLAVLLVVRWIQVARQIVDRDPVTQGWVAVLPALALVVAFAVVGIGLLQLGRRRQATPVAAELADELSRIGYPVAAALVAVALPVQLAAFGVQVVTALDPTGTMGRRSLNLIPLLDRAVDPIRILVGLTLLGLAVRAARRGLPGRALVTGCVGVMLVALARALVLGDTTAAVIDPDALNFVATALVSVVVLVALARRSLTTQRALAFGGVLILGALFSYRDFISNPVGSLLGFSGIALVLFGLTWDLLTGSGWGNGDSPRFPRHTRVLLVLTNSVLTMTVLAYAALVRDGSTTIYLDPYAEFGNLLFGTALLAAAVIAVLNAARQDRPVG